MSQKFESFGKFILLDKVAAGGMAEVWRAKAPGAQGIGKILAIKRILPQYTSNNEFIEMFKSEAKIAVNITQANIAQIYEFGEDAAQFYLVMEYIDGRNLRQVLSRCAKLQKALTIEQCVFVIAQVANGLDYAHRCLDKNTGNPLNIIHRDMSPQNIMISFEGEVKIVDFGIAKAETKIENTRAGTLKGKFGYMSPEQAEGLELDARTDIFSTGIVLWELLSGERLFVANNEVNTIRKIKECQIPSLRKINPNIHEELERITLKALAKDRSLRYQTAAELHRDLSRFLYKVNPEFTQHDLAITIKTLFKEDILEDRKKIVEFAKVQFPTPRQDERNHDSTRTLTETELTQSTMPGQIDVPKNLIPEAKLKEPELDIKVDSADLMRDVLKGQHRDAGGRIGTITPPPLRQNTGSYRARTSTNLGARLNKARKAGSWVTSTVVVVLALAGAGLVYFKGLGPMTTFISQLTQKGAIELGSTGLQGVPTPAPRPQVNIDASAGIAHVTIMTIPAGAQIEIDGKPSTIVTPGEITVPMNKQVTLVVRREGYMPLTKSYFTSEPVNHLQFTLTHANAFLNIEILGPGAEVYLDDQKIGDGPVINHYPVLGNKKYVVRAINRSTGFFDQQEVVVKPDSVKYIKMFLRKSK